MREDIVPAHRAILTIVLSCVPNRFLKALRVRLVPIAILRAFAMLASGRLRSRVKSVFNASITPRGYPRGVIC
jgi:hypothetical protein